MCCHMVNSREIPRKKQSANVNVISVTVYQSNMKLNQLLFLSQCSKKSLTQVGFEPTTFGLLDHHSTSWATVQVKTLIFSLGWFWNLASLSIVIEKKTSESLREIVHNFSLLWLTQWAKLPFISYCSLQNYEICTNWKINKKIKNCN